MAPFPSEINFFSEVYTVAGDEEVRPHSDALIANVPSTRIDLCDGVATIDTQIRACYVKASIAGEECDGAHKIFWYAHLADRNQASPLPREIGVVIEDLFGAAVLY